MGLEVQVGSETVECSKDRSLLWTMRLDAIVLVAEYTTNSGPWVDDWFLVLWELDHSSLRTAQVSVDENVGKLVIAKLAERSKDMIELGLVNSTDWRSRVVWPPSLKGANYFKLTPFYEPGASGWLKHKMFGPPLDLGLTDEVRFYLQSVRNKGQANAEDSE
jgi:hypothetical protein